MKAFSFQSDCTLRRHRFLSSWLGASVWHPLILGDSVGCLALCLSVPTLLCLSFSFSLASHCHIRSSSSYTWTHRLWGIFSLFCWGFHLFVLEESESSLYRTFTNLWKNVSIELGCSSVVECLPRMNKALMSAIPRTTGVGRNFLFSISSGFASYLHRTLYLILVR